MSILRSPASVATTALVVALFAAACGSDSGGVEATGAWARTSPMSADVGVVYMTLSSDDAVSVVSASVASDVAGRVELHETVAMDMAMDDDSMDDESMDDEAMDDESMDDEAMDDESMDDDAMDGEHGGDMAMTMQEVASIDIPAGGEAVLEPGGLHVMLLDLPDPLEEGEEFDVTLTTDAGDEITVPVEVRTEAP